MKQDNNSDIKKSMYKSVHKALGSDLSEDQKKKVGTKQGKDAIKDLLDPNFIAEAKQKVPPRRTAQMNKSEKGIDKLRSFVKNKQK